MYEKVIATRKEFLEWNSFITKVKPSSETSVEYREALFIFREKVEKHIIKAAREIFKLPDEVVEAMKVRDKERYEAGLKYAKEEPKSNQDYEIDPEKIDEWNLEAKQIDSKYSEALSVLDKNDLEFKNWCEKKIQLNIEKIELSKLPSFDSETFYKVAKIICLDLPSNDEDGVEVE